MDNLNELYDLQVRAEAVVQSNNQVSGNSRIIRSNIVKAQTNQISGVSTLTLDVYNGLARRVDSAEVGQQHIRPNAIGAHYDLTVYNDGSTDYYPYMFGKTLDHSVSGGFITKADGDLLIEAIKMNTQEKLQAIPMHSASTRKLEGVPVCNSKNNQGKQQYFYPFTAYGIDSNEHMFEMMEVYAMQIVRDIPFIDWDTDGTVGSVLTPLNAYGSSITGPTVTGSITRQTLLRGFAAEETVGPYVSQFLLHSYTYGNLGVTQKYMMENDSHSMLSVTGWMGVQQGVTGANIGDVGPTEKFVYSPRMLGSIVHRDPLYQFYYNAALISNASMNAVGYDNSSINSSEWMDGGPPAVLAHLSEVCGGALRVAWYNKYGQTLRLRPEVLAQRITVAHNNSVLRSAVPKLNTIKTNSDTGAALLTLVNADNISNSGEALGGKNYYLDVIYQEGSPTHPSLPAGHATVAGAAVTVLKAMLVTHETNGSRKPWVAAGRTALIADATGDNLISYSGGDASSMTIVGELNKLASNVSLGRDFAGVHFREDGTNGMLVGEEYAISFLQSKIAEYGAQANGMFGGFDLEKFDGTRVLITKDAVTNI